eukprot:TRINITY_DN4255_c1_g1_i1.p1 TRINITY_DN4255_c1_g1~~TRINITY_DN4255_c1_g1_i1.p1  ORF type:complete len:224 (+),score=27.38 TRINITY_DN4255_c1_g1_i1:59-673(+)
MASGSGRVAVRTLRRTSDRGPQSTQGSIPTSSIARSSRHGFFGRAASLELSSFIGSRGEGSFAKSFLREGLLESFLSDDGSDSEGSDVEGNPSRTESHARIPDSSVFSDFIERHLNQKRRVREHASKRTSRLPLSATKERYDIQIDRSSLSDLLEDESDCGLSPPAARSPLLSTIPDASEYLSPKTLSVARSSMNPSSEAPSQN